MSEHTPTWNPTTALSEEETEQLEAYERLLLETNQQVNLISRSDEDQIRLHHIIHSLALSYKRFPAGCTVVDWGTGGGLPGLPLAIRFPEVSFHLIDSTRKKILAVRRMIRQIGLANVEAWHGRAEDWTGSANYAVSRATTTLETLWQWYERVRASARVGEADDQWTPGLLALKGGALSDEIEQLQDHHPSIEVDIISLRPFLDDPFFQGKAIVAAGE